MTPDHDPIADLQAQVHPIEPTDTMAEAGRKALLNDLIKMLQHEAGSRSGENAEDVHDMRVATRRMRSTLRLLAAYYKPKATDPYLDEMRKLADALGVVRDLDVLSADLKTYKETLDADSRTPFQPIEAKIAEQLMKARKALLRTLDKGDYRRFVKDFSEFATKAGKGAYPVDAKSLHPFQVRHLLPELIYLHLSAVRAYEAVLENADSATLHALRIEFKRLRYAVSIFTDVLGGSSSEFIDELKVVQDHLGRFVDLGVAKAQLEKIAGALDPQTQSESITALQQYIGHLDAEQKSLHESFGEVWKHFNTKTVQRQLANAVASL